MPNILIRPTSPYPAPYLTCPWIIDRSPYILLPTSSPVKQAFRQRPLSRDPVPALRKTEV